jgi:hypothetical protein
VSEIERCLRELRRELRGVSWRRRRRVLAEAQDHLCCAVDDGLSEAEAVARLGPAGLAFVGFPKRRRPRRLAVVVGPVALLVLAPSLDGTLLRLGAGTTPSEASPPAVVTQRQAAAALRQCVSVWNSEASARWRSVAARASIERAHVSIIAMSTMPPLSRKSNVRIVGCTVNLQRALVASPYQRWIDVYAKRFGRTFRFNRLLRGHARTSVPATNARVDPSGHLALSSHLLPATCAAGPIGTRVVSVRALPSQRSLRFGATTQLAADPLARFIVVIRNAGRVPIQGAIASLEIGGQAHYGNAWWRSGPKVVARLDPGASVSLRFAPPALGHGVRLIRATTAAIACESQVADNSPVFRVHLE